MTFQEILKEFQARGETDISLGEGKREGLICTRHGKNTHNFWEVIDGELVCVDTSSGDIDTYFSPYQVGKNFDGKTTYTRI